MFSTIFQYKPRKNGDVRVEAKTTLSFCVDYCNDSIGGCLGLDGCTGLHFCLAHLFDVCVDSGECNFSHNMDSVHNMRLLRDYLLDHLNSSDLCQLFKRNYPDYLKHRQAKKVNNDQCEDPWDLNQPLEALNLNQLDMSMPGICRGYNSELGCRFGKTCRNVHLCRHYVRGSCRNEVNCTLSHNNNKLKKFSISFDAFKSHILDGSKKAASLPAPAFHGKLTFAHQLAIIF